jgi:hypothetical protein
MLTRKRSTLAQRKADADKLARYYRRPIAMLSASARMVGIEYPTHIAYFAWQETSHRFEWSNDMDKA